MYHWSKQFLSPWRKLKDFKIYPGLLSAIEGFDLVDSPGLQEISFSVLSN